MAFSYWGGGLWLRVPCLQGGNGCPAGVGVRLGILTDGAELIVGKGIDRLAGDRGRRYLCADPIRPLAFLRLAPSGCAADIGRAWCWLL